MYEYNQFAHIQPFHYFSVCVRTSVLKVLVHRDANAAQTAETFWLMLLATIALELVISLGKSMDGCYH